MPERLHWIPLASQWTIASVKVDGRIYVAPPAAAVA